MLNNFAKTKYLDILRLDNTGHRSFGPVLLNLEFVFMSLCSIPNNTHGFLYVQLSSLATT